MGVRWVIPILLLLPVLMTGMSESFRIIGPFLGLIYTLACATNLALYAYTGVIFFYAGVPGPETEIKDAFGPGKDALKRIWKIAFCFGFISFGLGVGAHLVPAIPLIVTLALGILVAWGSLATKGEVFFQILYTLALAGLVIMSGLTGLLGLQEAGRVSLLLPAEKVSIQLAVWHVMALSLLLAAIGSQITKALIKDEDLKSFAEGINILVWWAAALGAFSWLILAGDKWGGGLLLILNQFALIPFLIKILILGFGYMVGVKLHHDEHKIAMRVGYILRNTALCFGIIYFSFWAVTSQDIVSSMMDKVKSGYQVMDDLKVGWENFQKERKEKIELKSERDGH